MSDNAGLKLIKQVIEYGSIIGVPLASTTLQSIIPEGVLEVGIPTLANSLKNIGQEFAERMLSPRENLRVGSALILASEGIRKRLENGENRREDGFFDESDTGRSDADEVLENMVLKIQREPEEKKAPYIAKIYENSFFKSEVSADLGHKIIKSAEQLTYQQLYILSMVGRRENEEEALGDLQPNPQLDHPLELSKLLHDCFELVTNGYIQGGLTLTFSGRLPQYETLNPNSLFLENIGVITFNLMNLQGIPDEDIIPIAKLLRWKKSVSLESREVSWNPEI